MLSGKRSTEPSQDSHTQEPPTQESTARDYATFKKWIADRQRHFDEVNASPADIASIALQEGFPEPIVRQWEQHAHWENIGRSL